LVERGSVAVRFVCGRAEDNVLSKSAGRNVAKIMTGSTAATQFTLTYL
jgi:hypothetical protein